MGSRGIKSLKPIRHVSDLFPSPKSYGAFQMLAEEMKKSGNRLTTNAVSDFSKKLHKAKIYNRANFYWYVLEPLVELGFLERRPFWNESLKRTQYCYEVVRYDLPRYPISSGYMRDAYFLCREWNDLFFEGSQNLGKLYKSKRALSNNNLIEQQIPKRHLEKGNASSRTRAMVGDVLIHPRAITRNQQNSE